MIINRLKAGMIGIVLASFCQTIKAQTTSDSIVRQYLEELGVQFSHNNRVTLLMSGQDKFDDMFKAIRQARHSVHLEYFNFRNDSIASLLFDILREKRKEGVEVRALFDGFGNDSNNQPLLKKHVQALRQDSIDIWEFDPIRFPWINHIWPRDHRKIVVIDGSIAYTGGMNVADYYIKGTEQVGTWRDMHCRIEGGAVNQLQLIIQRNSSDFVQIPHVLPERKWLVSLIASPTKRTRLCVNSMYRLLITQRTPSILSIPILPYAPLSQKR